MNKKKIKLITASVLLMLSGCGNKHAEDNTSIKYEQGKVSTPTYITRLERENTINDEYEISISNIGRVTYKLPEEYKITYWGEQETKISTPDGDLTVIYSYNTESVSEIYNSCNAIMYKIHSDYQQTSFYEGKINEEDAVFAEYILKSDSGREERGIILSVIANGTGLSILSTDITDYNTLHSLTNYISINELEEKKNGLEMELEYHEADTNISLDYYYPSTWKITNKENIIAYTCIDGGETDNFSIAITKNSSIIDENTIDYEVNLDYSKIYSTCYGGDSTNSVIFTQMKSYFLREYTCTNIKLTVAEEYEKRREEYINNIPTMHTSSTLEVEPINNTGYGNIPSFGRFMNCETYYFKKAGENYQICFLYPDKKEESVAFIINTFFSKLY